ncbi:hypothetical protein J3Q64DRAFT_1753987 [Phycomyces blakesleeanus]|uniref:Uncharacterized protein n=1 Tax=Phycomyces blakesleeanus TaxID=4837 RepID=A0ABR3AT58_PHYBL
MIILLILILLISKRSTSVCLSVGLYCTSVYLYFSISISIPGDWGRNTISLVDICFFLSSFSFNLISFFFFFLLIALLYKTK